MKRTLAASRDRELRESNIEGGEKASKFVEIVEKSEIFENINNR